MQRVIDPGLNPLEFGAVCWPAALLKDHQICRLNPLEFGAVCWPTMTAVKRALIVLIPLSSGLSVGQLVGRNVPHH